MKTALRHLPSFLAPGLLLFVVSVQFASGLTGFVGSESGPLRLLEIPGLLLGWGGIALLAPLVLWLVLDWWGYSPSGFALKALGGIALGIALGGLCGLAGGTSGGGIVGAALADLLSETVGQVFAIFLLLIMAVPAAVLSFSKLGVNQLRAVRAAEVREAADVRSQVDANHTGAARAPATTPSKSGSAASSGAASSSAASSSAASNRAASNRAASNAAPSAGPTSQALAPTGLFGRLAARVPRRQKRATTDLEALARKSKGQDPRRGWYPQTRYDAEGNELPVVFGDARGIGAVRFAGDPDPEPAVAAQPASAPSAASSPKALPTVRDLLAGQAGDSAEVAQHAADATQAADAADDEYEYVYEDVESSFDEVEDGPMHVDANGVPVSQPKPAPRRVRVRKPRPAPTPVVVTPPIEADGVPVEGVPVEGIEASVVAEAVESVTAGPRTEAVRPKRPVIELRDSRDEPAEREVVHLPEAGPPASLRLHRDRTENGTDALAPGVRYADEAPMAKTASRQPTNAADHASKSGRVTLPPRPAAEPLVLEALRGTTAHRAAIQHAASRPQTTRAQEKQVVRASVFSTLGTLDTGGNAEHLRKLEASGLFDEFTETGLSLAGDLPTAADGVALASEAAIAAVLTAPTDAEPASDGATSADAGLSEAARIEAARRAAQKALVHQLRDEGRDERFGDAVEVALERGAVSLVLLSRRLGTTYARSRQLLDRLVATDVVGPPAESGGHPTRLTPKLWAEVRLLSDAR